MPTTAERWRTQPVGRCRWSPATMAITAAWLKPTWLGADAKRGFCFWLRAPEAGHMPAPVHLFGGLRRYPCGCGRDWGCIEAYTTISGLPHLLADTLPKHPGHPLASSKLSTKDQVLSLRGLAQKGDALALEIFDFQARALGLHAASLIMALDPEFVVLGGGLMDPESTRPEFRDRYLQGVRNAALPYMWPQQRERVSFIPASLGELSQAIGAAFVAYYAGEPR